MTSGSKRSRDSSSDLYGGKRPREDAKDWRDVHLSSDRGKDRDRRDRKSGDGHRGNSRDRHRHDRDHRREKDRRDDRDRDRDRDRHHRRPDDRQRNGSQSRTISRSDRDSERRSNGHHRQSQKDDSEKEEGEISPRHSRDPTPTPSASTRTSTPPPPKEPEPEVELDLAPTPPPADVILAERRAKRMAILAKYGGVASASISTGEGASPSPAPGSVGPSSAVQQPPSTQYVSDPVSQNHSAIGTPAPRDASAVPDGIVSPFASSPTVDQFSLAKEQEDAVQAGPGEQISAADYDPSLDRREDEEKRVRGVGVNDAPHADIEMIEVEEVEEEEEEDVDDMFAIEPSEKKKTKKVKKITKPIAPALITTTLDSAADSEGYYQIILGEQLDGGRYQVFSSLGKGMFANVIRARVLQGESGDAGREVAIKIVRCQESMYKAGLKEVQILNKLKQADPDDKKHVVRLERTFEHRGHLCLVFESLSMNLRDVVKRFGKDVGLNIRAVRAYAHQLFLAMSLLRKCNIMHADIKPDNILVNEQKTVIKLCDLGSASDASENEITPYLVSRFYRAPEIILGVPYDSSLDMWSIGCTLYELYTGKILFPGRSNNNMLLLMMELKGRFNAKVIKKAKFGTHYFDEMGGFDSLERDRVTGGDVIRKVHISKPARDLRARLLPSASKSSDEESKMILSFIDLLDKCLMLDPARRITPKEALLHPFIRG
ncbi:kinase-like protein [Rickenella mellea]|uniref:non-specific serine/threonine protein kinase n=1 Tax=Rickenella mellea TaxID=50990 RepID=A0A4Y7PU05_9AGAM|nr:kinase-like protein [Rickenella mellea]